MHNLVFLYGFYRSAGMKFVRSCILLVILLLLGVDGINGVLPTIPMFLLNCFVMIELFYHYKICQIKPTKTVAGLSPDAVLSASTLPVLYAYQQSHSGDAFVRNLLGYKQVQFFLERVAIVPRDLPQTQATKEDLMKHALKIAQEEGSVYVTTPTVVAAMLVHDEEQSKCLFNHRLKPEDLLPILQWTRLRFPLEETPPEAMVAIAGGGIGEVLTSGWTLETKKYTKDFTSYALSHDSDIDGREREYHQLQESLSKRENNNVLLIGEMGSGKEQIVRYFAKESFTGMAEKGLQHKKILEILIGPLLAGVGSRADLESRLQAIIEEVSHARNIMLYIPSMQNLLGSSAFGLDLSGALVPYLRDGNLPIIAAMTSGSFKTYMEHNELMELFTPIKLEELSGEYILPMLMQKSRAIEEKEHVIVTYRALVAAVKYGDRYKQESVLPGSAIDLLEDTISSIPTDESHSYAPSKRRLVAEADVTKKVEEKTKIALSEPDAQEKDLLLHLEDELHRRVIGQNEGISALSEAMRRLRSGVEEQKKPISFLFLGPTGVGKTETAKTLASIYFGGEDAMIRLDMSEYADEAGARRLLGAMPGQGDERGELTEKVHDHPYSLILLDEFEKAHQSILDLFLQVLEDGRLTDNKGKTVSFINTIIIATSNAGSEYIREQIAHSVVVDKQFQKSLLSYLQEHRIFRPELLNRFDDVITFRPLSQTEVASICTLLLQKVAKNLQDKDIAVSFNRQVIEQVAREGYDQEFGARPLRRYIQEKIEDLLARKLLSNELERGSKVRVLVSTGGAFSLEKEDTLTK
jgi:ATP-dependent Clp protease ATP-binding subunit ClpC